MSWTPSPHERDLFCNVYIDESSQNHRYLVLGALTVPYSHIQQFDTDIIEARENTNVKAFADDGNLREMKWQKVNAERLEAYKAVVKAAFSFKAKHQLSSLKDMAINCLAVDTSARPLKRTGDGDRETGFEKEFYFLSNVVLAGRYRDQLFRLFPDRRYAKRRLRESRDILNFGAYKWKDKRTFPFRTLDFADPETCLALQVVDIFMGALAFRLNRHYERPDANAGKKALCDYIWQLCKLEDPFVTSHFQRPRFMTWLHRPQTETSPHSGPQNIR
jgi:hypothetical protein